jgi:hypothetical protein
VATVGVVVMALGGGAALAGCSGGGGSDASKTSTTVGPKTSVDIPLGDVSSDSAGGPVTVAADQSEHVLDALLTYVKGAMVEPLRSGKPATADFAAVFDPTTLASATTTDRGVLLDEGLPRVTGDLTVKAQPVAMVGLGDQGGALTLITAALAVDATGATKTRGAPLHVTRTANFTLQPDPAGTWKITAYQVAVTREGADLSTTTTATAPTTGAAK